MPRHFKCPFGDGWSYVTTIMRSHDGVCTQSRLWRKRKTKELRWERL